MAIKTLNINKLLIGIIFFVIPIISLAQNINYQDSVTNYFKLGIKYSKNNETSKAFLNYKKVLSLKNKSSNSLYDSIIDETYLSIFNLLSSQKINSNNLDLDPLPYINEFYKRIIKKKDTIKIIRYYLSYASYNFNHNNINIPLSFYKKALKLTKKKNISPATIAIYSNISLLYAKINTDSASFYNKLAELERKNNNIKVENFEYYLNKANLFQYQKKFDLAIKELNKINKTHFKNYTTKSKKILYEKYNKIYFEMGKYKNAYKNLILSNKYNDSLNQKEKTKLLLDLDKKYQTTEKEKQILIEQQKNKQKQNLLYGSLAFLLFGGSIAFLALKNSRKKRQLAEQQKELEAQKNITLIKEQEITSINAMVSGQEKERKRIAEDLHDNIGSVLATLKLHFENLKLNREKKQFNQEELYLKTEHLIDETYLKVRSLAHAKNAGVIANQGLLSAIKVMAEKVSSANKTKIEVVDFGLSKPLENSLEITIFRIIQELITNIIKHAKATNATINLSLYDNTLNIIIEDNGKGFNIDKIDLKNGMGLSSIKTRVEHLKGTFEIDTTLKKGTTILINIPV